MHKCSTRLLAPEKAFLFAGTETEANSLAVAIVNAHTTQDTLVILHMFRLHHGMDVQAHRAVARTGFTIGAGTVVCF